MRLKMRLGLRVGLLQWVRLTLRVIRLTPGPRVGLKLKLRLRLRI